MIYLSLYNARKCQMYKLIISYLLNYIRLMTPCMKRMLKCRDGPSDRDVVVGKCKYKLNNE